MWSTWGAAAFVFYVMIVLRRHVALAWEIVDPASNTQGWYIWSIIVTGLAWQWWVALVLRGRGGRARRTFLFMAALVIAENVLYSERGWTRLVYGTTISQDEHDVLYAVDFIFDIVQGIFLASVAMLVAKRPIILLLVVLVVAVRVFAGEAVPARLPPIQTEIFTSVASLALYSLVGIALKVPMRLPSSPARPRETECT